VRKTIYWLLIVAMILGCLQGACFASSVKYAISENGIEFIKSQEGFTAKPTWDNSQYSVGYGSACKKSDYPNGITREQADKLLRSSLKTVESKLNEFIINNNMPLGQTQYDALASFTYNVGVAWLKDSRLSRLLVSGMFTGIDFASAIGVWCHTGKSLNRGLVLRRVREIQLFLHGDYTGKNSPDYVYVQFDAAGGSMLTDIYFYPKGSAYGMLQTAEKNDTMFLGWYKSNGTKLTEETVAEENLMVTARWQNPHPASKAFPDLQENAWYYGYVDDLYNGGVIQGYEDGTFRPNGTVTIGEALKMIFRACGYPAQSATALDPGQWASGYRALGVSLGVLAPDEAADLNVPASRDFIARVAAKTMKLTAEPMDEQIFADTTKDYVLALYQQNIVLGSIADNGARYFLPNSSIIRAEMCAIVSRIMNN